ncbi:MAG: hypothetical protein IJU66_06005 [Oscillospiraceae bacterium]|nr:hypothetical protein [Oscillospiraceae bacterium]
MTDIIHEHPKEETKSAQTPSPAAAEETPVDERTGQKRVYGYILLLFVVAFFLLLWSFLMNQRSNEEVISEVRGSTGTIQSTLDRNMELEREVNALEENNRLLEIKIAEQEKKDEAQEQDKQLLREEKERAEEIAAFYADVAALEYAYVRQDYERCRSLIDKKLWTVYITEEWFLTEDTEANRPFTRAHFEEILRALNYEGASAG